MTDNKPSQAQREANELRERLKRNTESMQNAAKKEDPNNLMSGVVETLGTFERINKSSS